MAERFLYDTHYQVDKPFALLDLTLSTASATERVNDGGFARRLVNRSKMLKVEVEGKLTNWKTNPDQMRYWIGNCQIAELLSRQNSYDYWLMNFAWLPVFAENRSFWGQLDRNYSRLARLLLLRWGWAFDAPMLTALLWKMNKLGTCNVGDLVVGTSHHVEDVLSDVFAAAREFATNPREQVAYRQKVEEFRRGFRYNTRRHKVCTHLGILGDAGLLVGDKDRRLHPGLASVTKEFTTGREATAESLRPGPLGHGTSLFLNLVETTMDLAPRAVRDLTEDDWAIISEEVKQHWRKVQKWDRKFLGIKALAELFIVKNLVTGTDIWSIESWRSFLTQRARQAPEELTVHVDRFGRVEYLRFSTP